MDKNDCWSQLKNILDHLDDKSIDREDLGNSFILVKKMIETVPPILAILPELEEGPAIVHRTRAFSSYLLCLTVQCQVNPEYRDLEQELYTLQTAILKILYSKDKKSWRVYIQDLIHLTLSLCLLYRRATKMEDSWLQYILPRKELERLGGYLQGPSNTCRIMENLNPEDPQFSNRGRILTLTGPESIRRLILLLSRLLLDNMEEMVSYLRRPEDCVRRLGLVLAGLKVAELQVRSLELLSSVSVSTSTGSNVKLVFLEVELVASFLDKLAMAQLDQRFQDEVTSIMLKYLKSRTDFKSDTDPVITSLLRSKLFKSVLSLLKRPEQLNLGTAEQRIVVEFLSSLLGEESGQGEEEENWSPLLRACLHLDSEATLVSLSWRELRDTLQIPAPSCKRKLTEEAEEEEAQRFSCYRSRTWARTGQILLEVLEGETDARAGLRLITVVLRTGKMLLQKSAEKWSHISFHILDARTVSAILSVLLRCLEHGLDPATLPHFFQASLDVISLVQACKQEDAECVPDLHLLAGLLSLPYLNTQARQSDLKLGKHWAPLLSLASTLSPGEGRSSYLFQSLLPLSLLPSTVAPRWRLSVFKTAAARQPEAVVRCIPNLVSVFGASAAQLASDVISSLDQPTSTVLSEEIARYSGLLICSIARSLKLVLSAEQDQVLTPVCVKCSGRTRHGTTAASNVGLEEVQPLFKLVGHKDPLVRRALLSMIVPFCTHSSLSNSAALLLLDYTQDSDFQNRLIFSKLVRFLVEAECSTLEGRDQVSGNMITRLVELEQDRRSEEAWNTYIPTLVSVQQCLLPLHSRTKVLNLLLQLFFNPETHQFAFIHCLMILQDQLLKEKAYILRWVAEKMCSKDCGDGSFEDDNLQRADLSGETSTLPDPTSESDWTRQERIRRNCMAPTVGYSPAPTGGYSPAPTTEQEQNIKDPQAVLNYLKLLVTGPAEADNFIQANLHHILPPVFYLSALRGLKIPLNTLASLRRKRPRALIDEYFPKIYAYIVVNCNPEELEMCMRYIKKETCIQLAVFITSYRLCVIEELLCVMGGNREKVIVALRACAAADEMFKNKGKGDLDTVKEYLSNNLNAALSILLSKLSNEATSVETKLNLLASLAELCQLLGPHYLSPVKHSLLACLKNSGNLARRSSLFHAVSVSLWGAFIKNIDLKDLEVILDQVLVGLSYHITVDKERILPLFNYLLVQNRNQFKDIKASIALLPDIPELQSLVRQVLGRQVELRSLLQGILENLDHEAVEVRQQALNTLKSILGANMGAVQGLLLRSDQADSIVSALLQKLMNGMSSREPEEELRYMAAECIGKIGAVDPGKLELSDGNCEDTPENRNFLLDVRSVDFCARLIMELVRACQSSRDTLIVDTCMFSLQTVLRIYGIGAKRNTFAAEVIRRLSDAAREIVDPLMSSNYVHNPKPQEKILVPVYGSAKGRNYKDWLANFSQALIDLLLDPKVKEVFTSSLPVLKKDVSTAEFLLPHLFVSVVCGVGEEGATLIIQEVNRILQDPETSGEEGCVEGNTDKLVAQTLFSVLDHLNSWLRAKYSVNIQTLGKSDNQLRSDEITKATKEKQYQAVVNFMGCICNERLANLSYNTGAFHRSAFYLDRTLGSAEYSEAQLNAMQRLYARLEEPDLVVGVAAVRRVEPSLENLILYNQAVGNFQDALCCFERQRQVNSLDYSRLVQCYLNIDQPSTAATLAAGLVAKDSSLAGELAPYQAEAAWQLGQWQELNQFTKEESLCKPCWELNLSKVILSAYKMDRFLFQAELQSARKDILKTLSAVSSEKSAYRKSYPHIVRLAMLREVEHVADTMLLTKSSNAADMEGLLDEFEARLNYTQVSWSYLEPVLRLRRGMFTAVYDRLKSTNASIGEKVKSEIGECWLRSARIARKAGQLQESYSFLLEAEKYENPKIFLESAKLKWERGSKTEAIAVLKKGLSETFPEVHHALDRDAGSLGRVVESLDSQGKGLRELCASGNLLLARYVEEAASLDQEGVKTYFDNAKDIVKNSDEIFYYYAKFMDKKSQKMSSDQTINQSEIVTHAALTYLRSLRYGPTFLDECMPRLLTIWLDFAATIQESIQAKSRNAQTLSILDHATKQLSKLNKTISVTKGKIPTYYFLTAFPQIVSRICHSNQETYLVLKSLMVKVLVEFPQQAFWHMVCVSKNRDATRTSRCKEIFNEAMRINPQLKRLIDDAVIFSQKIDDLCDAKVTDKIDHVSLKEILPSLPALFKSTNFSQIILPIERNMVVTSPTSEADLETHNPFPAGVVTIQGVEDDIQVMVSLVKPKKLTLRGSDGKLYSFLAKPKDDLRRDCRLMDFGNLLNRMFRKEPETRKRGLRMRTYMVVPTNETNGLIEWVGNLKGLRHIIINLLKEKGVSLMLIQKRYIPRADDSATKKMESFRKITQEMKGKSDSPFVFREWFVRSFPDPQAWFAARLAFTRTTAVMSIMGYILGLGDRHLENINVDTTTGQTFHVDMNSLFNVAETYKVPEIVPFRLTHNIVDGFGPLGIEGPYRISCEVTLRMMRNQKDLLMSVLRPFIFDPLVDWTVRDKSKKMEVSGGEEVNKPGKEALDRVEDRLDGCVSSYTKKRKGNLNPPLSVEGQVDHIIREAMSVDNLALMYWGWTPFL